MKTHNANQHEARIRLGARVGEHRALPILSREDGFTMIELITSLSLIAVLFAAFAALTSSTMTHSGRITSEGVLQSQVRTTVNELLSDLRQAYPLSPTATSVFVPPSGGQMSPTSLTFYSPDRTYSTAAPTAFHLREISYQLSSGNLQRATAISSNTTSTTGTTTWAMGSFGSWATRVAGVTNSDIFTYLTYNTTTNQMVATTDPTMVQEVVVKLTVTTSQSNGNQFTYTDSAMLRTG